MATILKTKAPNLPIPTISYSQTYQESFSNAQRLYFNTLDTANGQTIQAVNNLYTMSWLSLGTGIW
jgi:hypothetical protein